MNDNPYEVMCYTNGDECKTSAPYATWVPVMVPKNFYVALLESAMEKKIIAAKKEWLSELAAEGFTVLRLSCRGDAIVAEAAKLIEYVYLLWDHLEDGPGALMATLDRTAIVPLAKQIANGFYVYTIPTIEQLLLKDDSEIEGINKLSSGWGGLHFQVVRLVTEGER